MTPQDAADAGITYVGRRCAGFPTHPLFNPFKVSKTATADERADVVRRYTEYFLASPDMVAAAKALKGKTLGCWCGDWDGTGEPGFHCHAVVLAKFADAGAMRAARQWFKEKHPEAATARPYRRRATSPTRLAVRLAGGVPFVRDDVPEVARG